jgi:uncharacterized protein with FMN-binding domain
MATARLHRGLVALSASAVAAVYLAGYLRTQSADAGIGAAAEAVAAAPRVIVAMPTPTSAPRVVATAPSVVGRSSSPTPSLPTPSSPSPAPTASPAALAQAGYKDGTYTGSGTSRRGGVVVSVVVQGGRIASVTITNSTLQYPVRDIAGLPAQVVERQSAQVDTVSRATYSSQAFRGAVSQALAKAV